MKPIFPSPCQVAEKESRAFTTAKVLAALPFVIPTRISCHVALDSAACAPFIMERRMKAANAIKLHRKFRGSEVEGSAVSFSDKAKFNQGSNAKT